jgi:hypothetical protein
MNAQKSPTQATWCFDVISPFSNLALGKIEELASRSRAPAADGGPC